MSEGLTAAAAETLTRLEQEATPGPWRAATKPHPEAVRLKTEAVTVSGPHCRIYTMARDYGCLPETFARQCVDAELIAAMRNALPTLLTELASLRAALAEAQRERDVLKACGHPRSFHGDGSGVCLMDAARCNCETFSAATPATGAEWQDIATAPKDGTELLLTNGAFVLVGQFDDDQHDWSYRGGYLTPKHWMPLPPTPSAQTETPR